MLAFFFAGVALHEAGFFEDGAEFGELEDEGAGDAEFDGIDLAGEATSIDADGDVVILLFLSGGERVGDFGHEGFVVAEILEGGLVIDGDVAFAF